MSRPPLAAALGLILGLVVFSVACSRPDDPDAQPKAAPNPLADAPQDWAAFQAWAARELAEFPGPVPLPSNPTLSEPQWPLLRLDELLARATVRCDWQPADSASRAIAAVGPFRSDRPNAGLKVEAYPKDREPSTLLTIKGFRIQREQVGAISIELHQPFGTYFELRWARAGRLRVPVPDNDRFWTLNIATDGFAEWSGPLGTISLRAAGIGQDPIEIRSIRFLRREDSFPQAAGVRRVVLDSETRNALYLHCPGEVRFPSLTLPERAAMQFGLGVVAGADRGDPNPDGEAALEILVESDGKQTSVWKQPAPAQPRWSDQSVSLKDWGGQTVSLILRATGGAGGAVACWANPVVYQPVAEPPCVIVYLIDTVSADHVGLYGYTRATMPRLSALARQGVWFANAFANSSRTVESIADLMLSLPTEAHGVHHASARAAAELVTLPEALRAAGFATVSFCTNVNAGPRQNIDQGFDHFFDHLTYWWNGGQVDRTVPIEEVMAWLQVHRDRPTFLYIHTAEPHTPYTPLPGFAGRFDPDYQGQAEGYFDYDNNTGFRNMKTQRDLQHIIALYDEEIAYADARLGRFVDTLEGAGLLAGIHLFVTADHGEEFGQHGSWEHGQDLHNELINIPLVAMGPRFTSRGREATPAQLYDLMPTILDMFNLPAPYPLAGHSLLSRLTGTQDQDVLSNRVIVASNHYYRAGNVTQYAAIEEGRWKLMYQGPAKPGTRKRFELFGLYDRQTDPGEQRNVMTAHPGVARRLIERVVEWHHRYAPLESRGPTDVLMLDADQLEELRSLGYIK